VTIGSKRSNSTAFASRSTSWGDELELYSRSGRRFSRRYPVLVDMLRDLAAKSAIIDGEIVASDAAGMPNFRRLFLGSARPGELIVWAFDLLAINGKDLRRGSLEARLGRLQALLSRSSCQGFWPPKALQMARRCSLWPRSMVWRGWPQSAAVRLTGLVRGRGWRKIKTYAWREANRERWRLFERG
jgi:hypothetical protein